MPAAILFKNYDSIDADYAEMGAPPTRGRAVRSHRRRHAGEIAAADLGKRTAGAKCATSDSPRWILKIPALVTTQYAKGLGNTVPDIASMLPDSTPIDKLMFLLLRERVFCSLLKRLPGQRTTVLLCGM